MVSNLKTIPELNSLQILIYLSLPNSKKANLSISLLLITIKGSTR